VRILCLTVALPGLVGLLGAWGRPVHAGPAPFSPATAAGHDDAMPLPRAPATDRRPLELAGGARLFAPLCAATGGDCAQPLGFGGALAALHRTSPFFAWGGDGHYLETPGATHQSGAWRRMLELSLVGRLYLTDEGSLDPYLELGFGYGWERERWTEWDRTSTVDRRGPSARVGGGVDVALGGALEAGVSLVYREDFLGPGPRCGADFCPGGAIVVRGGVLAGLTFTVSIGDPL